MNELTMNDIVISTNSDGVPCVSSLEIAQHFEKRHADVLESIEKMKTENSVLMTMFFEGTYKSENNRKSYKCYHMTRDGFTLLAMGFTGAKALDWKLKYIQAFNTMEERIKSGAVQTDKHGNNKARRLDIQAMNAQTRAKSVQAKQEQILLGYYRDMNLSPESVQLLCASAYKRMTGEEFPLALPETEKTWSAGEVGKMLGVSANKIGRLANANGLKTDAYGITVLDTAHNGKQIPTFRYNQNGIDKLKELLKS